MTDDIVIVGSSVGGVRTAEALRRRGFGSRITLIGAETRSPYDRPPLSKAFLTGQAAEDDLALLDGERLDRLELELRLGERAVAVDVGGRQVRLASGQLVSFGAVVIATGSLPRRLPALDGWPGVHVLRTLDDALAIRAALATGARVVVVGGGFIGAEVAWSCRALGLEVTIIDPVPALMTRGLGPELGEVLAGRHADHGVRLRLGRSVAGVEGSGRVERLVLDDGTILDADVVVVGIGADPAVGWLAGSGLPVDGGLCCDAWLRVHGTDSVYAVGDMARWRPRVTPRRCGWSTGRTRGRRRWRSRPRSPGARRRSIRCPTCGPTSSAHASRCSARSGRVMSSSMWRVARTGRSSWPPPAGTGRRRRWWP